MTIGAGGGIGALGGGYFADRFSRKNMGWQLWLPGIGSLAGALLSFGVLLARQSRGGDDVCVCCMPSRSMPIWGRLLRSTQTLSPVRMRALASALLLFVINIVGLGLGPQLVGILSDLLPPCFGAGIPALRHSDRMLPMQRRCFLQLPGAANAFGCRHWRRSNQRRETDVPAVAIVSLEATDIAKMASGRGPNIWPGSLGSHSNRSSTTSGMTVWGTDDTPERFNLSGDEVQRMSQSRKPRRIRQVYSASYVRYAVGILSVVYLVNLTDRQILAILMQPIKQEMQLSDTAAWLSGRHRLRDFLFGAGVADRASGRQIFAGQYSDHLPGIMERHDGAFAAWRKISGNCWRRASAWGSAKRAAVRRRIR